MSQKWKLTLKVIPLVLMVLAFKSAVHYVGWEYLSLSPLFTAIISANIFLIGFLISGVLGDYKEGEKLPGELSVSLEIITDECWVALKSKNTKEAKDCLQYVLQLNDSILAWFHKKEKTFSLMEKISGLNEFWVALESTVQPTFLNRMKQEQGNIRRIITRIHTIRETSFNDAAYAIAEVITLLLVLALIFIKMTPYYESLFFSGFVSFILIYMILLIKDLDNPFGYYAKGLAEEVSLKPLEDLKKRLERMQ